MAAAAVGTDETGDSSTLSPPTALSLEEGNSAVACAEIASPTKTNRRLNRKSSLTKNVQERRRIRQNTRVRFREGEELTDASPVQGPWKDIVPPSCARVLEVYRTACAKVKVRPLNPVVDFVQKIDDFGTRQDNMNLKGVRLEARHCEALEEVFRRISVNLLNLDSCGLEDDGALALLEMVEFYEAAYVVILSNNPKLTRPTWLALSRLMKRSAFLHYIDVAQTTVDVNAIPLLARSLRANCPLMTLHLERNSLSGPRLVILAAALKTNTNLAHLYLGDNGLTSDDALMLGAMLKGNRRLELLDIRDNHLLDQGAVLLCQALSCQEEGLNALVMWNNRFTAKAVPAMSTMLALHRTLHTLEVGRNRLGNDGMDSLKLGLMRNRSVLRLGIMELGLTTTGTIALAEYIGESPVLETVNVRRNNIRIGGLLALARAHKLSKSLIKLDVDTSIKCDQRDQEMLRDLTASLEEYSFRNQQLAAERQLLQSQEAAIESENEQTDESTDPVADSTGDAPSEEHDVSETNQSGEALDRASEPSAVLPSVPTCGAEQEEVQSTGSGAENGGVVGPAAASSEVKESPERHLAEGLALKASHLHIGKSSDDNGDNGNGAIEVDDEEGDEEDDRRCDLKSPLADDSITFSTEFEAALEELHVASSDATAITSTSNGAEPLDATNTPVAADHAVDDPLLGINDDMNFGRTELQLDEHIEPENIKPGASDDAAPASAEGIVPAVVDIKCAADSEGEGPPAASEPCAEVVTEEMSV